MRLRPKARIDVLSGFLGSGKTTLLRRHLAAIESSSVAVVINEFGTTAIDHRLVRFGGDELRVLAAGCACCAVADRLSATLLELLRDDARNGRHLLSRIVLETSGLADPASILNTIRADENLDEYLSIGSCVVTFDAVDGIGCASLYPEVRHQLAAADTIVITKADLVDPGALRAARAFVQDVNPLAQVATAGTTDFAVAHLFDRGASMPTPMRAAATHHVAARHAGGIASFCLQIDDQVDWASFSVWLTCLLNRHGSRILRFKGVLASNTSELPLVVHGVRHLVYPPQHLPEPDLVRGRSDLVFIVDGLDPAQIDASLHRFLRFAGGRLDRVADNVVAQ
jgi:G3E family GTPase